MTAVYNNMNKKRNIKTYNRTFSLILYEEDIEQMKALEYIKQNYCYAAILHTEDKLEDGTKKKPHFHVVLSVGSNPRNRKSVANELKIAENYIEGCNKDKMLLYLIHYEQPDKYQYDIEMVEGGLKEHLMDLIRNDNKTEAEKLAFITYLIETETIYDLSSLIKVAIKEDSIKVMRQNQYILIRLIEEIQRRDRNDR